MNIDWSPPLRIKKSRVGSVVAPLLLRGERLQRFRKLTGEIVVHDLRQGIPARDDSVDVVYHCHVLEHLDRVAVPGFLAEIWRVLRPGGIHRIVVPDLERSCRAYLDHLDVCLRDPSRSSEHDSYVAGLIEQSVRKEASGTSRQPPVRRWVENAVLGDARRRGETHQWMYDRVNASLVLRNAGFREIKICGHVESGIRGWAEIGLDLDDQGREYRPGSLYVEAKK